MEKREVKAQVNHLTKRFGDLLVLDDIFSRKNCSRRI